MVILIPITILYFKYTTQSSYTITVGKVDAITDEIIKTANQVNIYGKDTQVKLSLDIPKDITEIRFKDKEIIFKIRVKTNEVNEVAKVAEVNFSSFGTISLNSGKKNVIVKSLGDSILVNSLCRENEFNCATKQQFSSCNGNQCKLKCVNSAWSIESVCTSQCNNGICN